MDPGLRRGDEGKNYDLGPVVQPRGDIGNVFHH